MDLISFFTQETIFDKPSVFCFVGNEYPSLLFSVIKQKIASVIPSITLSSLENEGIFKAQLEMSFLGSRTFYWLSPELFATSNRKLISYLESYPGPNIISFFCQNPIKSDTIISVEIPSSVDESLFIELYIYLFPHHAQRSGPFIKTVFKHKNTISLDAAYLLMHYSILVGNKSDNFIQEWFTSLIVPEKSLFTLSSHFFAKKGHEFFELWNMISEDYSELFWTTYWSEQLFKAHSFIILHNEKKFTQAKRIGNRLPFSFLQKDWKLSSLQELKDAHDQLYGMEWNLKNSLSADFDHFFLQFFLQK